MRGKYFWIAVAGIVLWISETAYFGWNDEPINNVEKTLDFLSAILIVWGIIGDIFTNLSITKKTYLTENTTINAKTVEFAPKIGKDASVEKTDKGVKIKGGNNDDSGNRV